jgi:hypothetical protein
VQYVSETFKRILEIMRKMVLKILFKKCAQVPHFKITPFQFPHILWMITNNRELIGFPPTYF